MSSFALHVLHIVFVFLCFWHYVGINKFARQTMVTEGGPVSVWGYFLMQVVIVLLWIYVVASAVYYFLPVLS